jgi:hypothetical protein
MDDQGNRMYSPEYDIKQAQAASIAEFDIKQNQIDQSAADYPEEFALTEHWNDQASCRFDQLKVFQVIGLIINTEDCEHSASLPFF